MDVKDEEYLEYCYRFYRDERDHIEALLGRVGGAVSSLVLVGGASIALLSFDWFGLPYSQLAVLAAIVCSVLVLILLIGAGVLLALCQLARAHRMPSTLEQFENFRRECDERAEEMAKAEREAYTWKHTFEQIRDHLVASATDYRKRTRVRASQLAWANRLIIAALIPLLLEAGFAFVARVNLLSSARQPPMQGSNMPSTPAPSSPPPPPPPPPDRVDIQSPTPPPVR